MAPHAAVESGWIVLDIPSPGSTAGEAALLKRLTRAGVVAARLERVPPSLAELLQRAIARADGERSLSNGGRG